MDIQQWRDRLARGQTHHVLDLPDGADPAATDLDEALRWCAHYGDVTACRWLIERRGARLVALGTDHGLGDAAFHGHVGLCAWLLAHGADARAADPQTGETALHAATSNEDRPRYDRIIKLLVAAGADPNAATHPGRPTGAFMRDARTRGETPLHRAALFGSSETIDLLLAAGADREHRDAHGETPLAWASWARRPVAVLRPLLYGEHRIHPMYVPLRERMFGEY